MVLDQFCASTGLARSSARRYLTSAYLGNDKVLRVDRRCCRPTKYSTEAKHKLLWLWRVMGQPCGKYLASVRTLWLDALESHGELVIGQSGWTTDVRDELCAMSAATIDRYLKQERQRLALKGISTTKAGALLRNSIQIRKAGEDVYKRQDLDRCQKLALIVDKTEKLSGDRVSVFSRLSHTVVV